MEPEYTFAKQQKKAFYLFAFIVIGAAAVCGTLAYVASDEGSPIEWSASLTALQAEEVEFRNFIAKYSKTYSTDEEYAKKFSIYRENIAFIRSQNSMNLDWALGLNSFADMTPEEFSNIYLSKGHWKPQHDAAQLPAEALVDLAEKIDWRDKGAVTPVKNQGKCGSGWAFSTAGAIEALWAKNHELVSLSEQQLIDCSEKDKGCDGGILDSAFKYVIEKGITSEESYPYAGVDETCKMNPKTKVVTKIVTTSNVGSKSMTDLQRAVNIQPVSVVVDASPIVWQFYLSGVITKYCGIELDHSVLIVGYDSTASTKYWVVKNSWGTDWGLTGYVHIKMSDGEGVCGINISPIYPIGL